MSNTLVDLIFEGNVEPGHSREEVSRTLEDLFQFDTESQSKLFSGQPIVLGEGMDAATANSFKQALASAGAATRLEAANDPTEAGARQQKRGAQRRILAIRRDRIRAAAILPDRRQGRDRRG